MKYVNSFGCRKCIDAWFRIYEGLEQIHAQSSFTLKILTKFPSSLFWRCHDYGFKTALLKRVFPFYYFFYLKQFTYNNFGYLDTLCFVVSYGFSLHFILNQTVFYPTMPLLCILLRNIVPQFILEQVAVGLMHSVYSATT